MKFIGGTHHGRDAPMWVQQLVLAGWVEIKIPELQPESGYRPAWAEPERPPKPRIETYHVRTWQTNDRPAFKFLAIAGKDRDWIESMAWPLFGGQ